jgi:hypothetical protein
LTLTNIYLCRGSDPESKGRIEAVVKYAKYGFAEHRIFHDIETFNVDCLAWLNRTANKKIHETTKKIPAEVFALEQEYLIPVPQLNNNYSVNINIPYPVRKDNIVLYKSNRYRVPKGTYEPGKMVYMDLCQYFGHKKLNFFSLHNIDTERKIIKLQEPPLQPAVEFYNPVHCVSFCGYTKTQYIQRELFQPLQM